MRISKHSDGANTTTRKRLPKTRSTGSSVAVGWALSMAIATPSIAALDNPLTVTKLATYTHGGYDNSAAEIIKYDRTSGRFFVTNAELSRVDILAFDSASETLGKVGELDVSVLDGEGFSAASPTSVSTRDGVVAVAVPHSLEYPPGRVAFFDAATGALLNSVEVGALPDMLTFSPQGNYVLTADEGQPVGSNDPVGGVSIIDVRGPVAELTQANVRTAGFDGFNGQASALINAGVVLSYADPTQPNTVAQNLEPEYVAVSADETRAWAALQEANTIAVIDMTTATVTDLVPMGMKDYRLPENPIDLATFDGINVRNYPVFGLYQPDAMIAVSIQGEDYLVTANEGDNRGFELTKVRPGGPPGSIDLDPLLEAELNDFDPAFNCSTLSAACPIITASFHKPLSDTDGDGDADRLVMFGTRSLSILNADGDMVFDSGAALEQALADPANDLQTLFNADNTRNSTSDARSGERGPEPEGLTFGNVGGAPYAFMGLERSGQIAVFDLSDPTDAKLVQLINNRTLAGGDLGPEGLEFIGPDKTPNGETWLVVANEVSGTSTLYRLEGAAVADAPVEVPLPWWVIVLLGGALSVGSVRKSRKALENRF